jgi:hypothetical protein
MKNKYIIVVFLSFILCILIGISSITSLYLPDFYYKETLNWQAQCIGQDYINAIIIVPFLLLSIFCFLGGKRSSLSLWAGSVLYLLYTYLIYCFDVHFNIFFVVYCFILGICFYLLLYFFYTQIHTSYSKQLSSGLRKTIGIYFIALSLVFYFLWLTDILPAIFHATVPQSLIDVGLPTNAVHVIDLSVLLPGMFITGVLLLKNSRIGILLAPILLSFFILMDITIGALTVFMYWKKIATSLAIAFIMGVLTIWSLILLIFYLRSKNTV